MAASSTRVHTWRDYTPCSTPRRHRRWLPSRVQYRCRNNLCRRCTLTRCVDSERTGVAVRTPSWKPSCWHATSAEAAPKTTGSNGANGLVGIGRLPQTVPQPPVENTSRRPNWAPLSDVPPPVSLRSPSAVKQLVWPFMISTAEHTECMADATSVCFCAGNTSTRSRPMQILNDSLGNSVMDESHRPVALILLPVCLF